MFAIRLNLLVDKQLTNNCISELCRISRERFVYNDHCSDTLKRDFHTYFNDTCVYILYYVIVVLFTCKTIELIRFVLYQEFN